MLMNSLGSLHAEFPQRIERARTLMSEYGLDAVLVFTGPNLVYFTGMPCTRSGSRPAVYLLPRRGEPLLIVHGIGLVVTELPSLSEEDPTVLAADMVVTIEPGVATEYGTFHIEENVLVTDDGPRVLTLAPWELWTI